jgi:putative aminopeptidase FrvX
VTVPPVLHDLLTAVGPSGYEGPAATVFRSRAVDFAEVTQDTVGSSFARVAGTADGPVVAIFGHIDEIGLIVSHVDGDGFLWFLPVGGWDPIILVGQRVTVMTRDGPIPGVVGKKPIHLMTPDDRKRVPELKDLHIDIGAEDGDEAKALVAVGDVAVIDADPLELPNGRLASRALDNRLGAYVAFEAARLVAEAGGAPGDVIAVAPTQEETTFGGAVTAAFGLAPEVAIVVDVTHATDAPGIDEKQNGSHPLGSGPALVRGPAMSPGVFALLHATAQDEGIDFTVEAASPRTGTDADAVHLSREGVPTGIVQIPLRYMHSPVEMVQLSDVEDVIALLTALALRLEAGQPLARW